VLFLLALRFTSTPFYFNACLPIAHSDQTLISTWSKLSSIRNNDHSNTFIYMNIKDIFKIPIVSKAQLSSAIEITHKVIHRMKMRTIPEIEKSFTANSAKN